MPFILLTFGGMLFYGLWPISLPAAGAAARSRRGHLLPAEEAAGAA